MAEGEPKKMETEAPAESNPPPPPEDPAPTHYAADGRSVFPVSDEAAAAFVETEISHAADEKFSDSDLDRIESEKRLALIKAWEDSEKTRVENKAYRKLSVVNSWENSKRATVEAQLRIIEEKLEKKRAEYEEERNKQIAEIHRAGDEKRASIQEKRSEQFVKVEDMAAKYRAAGFSPKKLLGCFTS